MQAEIKGTTMPVLEVTVQPGEQLISTHGELSWMTGNMQMSQTAGGGGFIGGLKRVMGGGGIFLTRYEPSGGPGMIAFAACIGMPEVFARYARPGLAAVGEPDSVLAEIDTDSIFAGYNSIRFDEEMLRHALFQTLHPAYLTSNHGNCRADVLGLVMAAATLSPACLSVPRGPEGRPVYRLEGLAAANGIAHASARCNVGRRGDSRSMPARPRQVFRALAALRPLLEEGDGGGVRRFGGRLFPDGIFRERSLSYPRRLPRS